MKILSSSTHVNKWQSVGILDNGMDYNLAHLPAASMAEIRLKITEWKIKLKIRFPEKSKWMHQNT